MDGWDVMLTSFLSHLRLFGSVVQYKTASFECQSLASFLTKSCAIMLLLVSFGEAETRKGGIIRLACRGNSPINHSQNSFAR
jgi:hypothetical protein